MRTFAACPEAIRRRWPCLAYTKKDSSVLASRLDWIGLVGTIDRLEIQSFDNKDIRGG
jgi:hypothetical protein